MNHLQYIPTAASLRRELEDRIVNPLLGEVGGTAHEHELLCAKKEIILRASYCCHQFQQRPSPAIGNQSICLYFVHSRDQCVQIVH